MSVGGKKKLRKFHRVEIANAIRSQSRGFHFVFVTSTPYGVTNEQN